MTLIKPGFGRQSVYYAIVEATGSLPLMERIHSEDRQAVRHPVRRDVNPLGDETYAAISEAVRHER